MESELTLSAGHEESIMIGTLIFILASISFMTVIGGAVFEHIAVVPVWAPAVPASLSML